MKKISFVYRIFKAYLKFWHDKVYYDKTYTLNTQNIPDDGTPLLIVSNHQFCLNDPLGVLFSINDRKPNFITRADVFALHPIANKFLRSIGLLPAFRLQYEGMNALDENTATFKVSEQALLEGATVMMFPEAGHQDKHWLGTFSFGYTKLAFEAAEMGNFQTDIKILPSCNHYSRYSGMRNRFLVKFGTPISLAPYYELYKTKPRTAQRQVNRLVRAQIESMMLNITDLENYGTIDYIRGTFGTDYALAQGHDPKDLPARLLSDKEINEGLNRAKAGRPEQTAQLYKEFDSYAQALKEKGIDDAILSRETSALAVPLRLLLQLILLPLWIFSLWPSLLMYYLPRPFFKRTHDKMFEGTFLFALNMLFFFPILGLATLLIDGLSGSWIYAIVHVLLIPYLCIFAWNYRQQLSVTLKLFRKHFTMSRETREQLKRTRAGLWQKTEELLKNN